MTNEKSMEKAITRLFKENPNKIFTNKEIYSGMQDYFELSDYQSQINRDYPQPNYHIWIRSILKRLENKGIIEKVGRGRRRLVKKED